MIAVPAAASGFTEGGVAANRVSGTKWKWGPKSRARGEMLLLRQPRITDACTTSPFQLTNQAKWLELSSEALTAIECICNMANIEDGVCFFTDSLPLELRKTIYEMVLTFDNALRLQEQFYSRNRPQDTSLLCVCRQIYNEALPGFYARNTIVVMRSHFCRRINFFYGFPFKPRLIRNLYVKSLGKSILCSALPWQPGIKLKRVSCKACEPSPHHFLQDLQLLPHLQKVVVNYDGHFGDIMELRTMLRATGQDDGLQCLRVGEYRLQGEWLGPVQVSLVNAPLSKAWPSLLAVNPDGQYHSRDTVYKLIMNRCGISHLCPSKLSFVIERNDCPRNPRIPKSIAAIWPRSQPEDLRIAEVIGRNNPAFMQAFNDSLELTIAEREPLEMKTSRR